MATAIKLEIKKALVTFFEMTSNAKRIPAIGLPNKAVTPAATPAQINSVLYCLKTFSFRWETEPMVAEATTVETSIPVDPPKTTVSNPLMKWDGILYPGRFFDLVLVLSKISLMPLFSFFLNKYSRRK